MEIIKPETHIGFVSKMRNALLVSIVLILIAIVSLIYHKGPNWGVEFMGGTELHIKLSQRIKPGEIMAMLRDVGYAADSVQSIGLSGDNEYLIQFSPETVDFEGIQKFQNRLEEMFSEFPEFKGASILRLDFIGPKVGKELIEKAVLSILLACVGILIYLIIRFEFAFAMGGVIALIHDTVITLGAISVTDKEFTLAIVAGLLTVIGYSVNDTIVIFDRIRENLKKAKGKGFKNTINESLNQTLSRTILTSLTVFLVLIPLFILGGSVIHDFAFTLIVGVLIGTYSSIFVATPFMIYWRQRKGAVT
ncbi:protein translocase subunit SecF [Desulfobacterota bacterium AH_259_B03_O07]|nr:protein translocase subunit SecF [Desulfobacterota bacterium AH_259_B03_O07]